MDLSWEVLHLPGETLLMIEVRGRDCVATHDGLTGLAYRSLFLDRLGHLLRRASPREQAFTLAIAGTREAAAKVLGDIVALSSAPVRLERGAVAAKRAGGAAFRFFRRAPACPWQKVRADA